MAAKNRNQYQGFLFADHRLRSTSTLWAAQSSYDQQGPRPGRPSPDRDTEVLLLAEGTQPAGVTLNVLANEGGPVGRTARAAGIVWKTSTDGANAYRGWESPHTLSAWEPVQWQASGNGVRQVDIINLEQDAYADRVVIVGLEERTVGPATFHDVVAWYRDPDTRVWSGKVTIHDGQTDGNALAPCVVEAGDVLYCLHYCRGVSTASSQYYIRVQVSTDGGATWSTARQRATVEVDVYETVTFGTPAAKYAPQSMRAAYQNGQVLVMVHLHKQTGTGVADYADELRQYASSQLSTRLDLVGTTTATVTDRYGPARIAVQGGRFVVGWVGSDGDFHQAVIASAYDRSWDLEETQGLSGLATTGANPVRVTSADLALVVDDAGILYQYHRVVASQRIEVYYNDDDAAVASWTRVSCGDTAASTGIGSIWDGGATDHYLHRIAACWQRGRCVMAHQWVANTGTNDDSVAVAYLGGWSDLTIAPILDGSDLFNRHPWQRTRLPIERAQDTSTWTASTTGTVANSLNSAGYELLSSGNGAASGRLSVFANDSTTGDVLGVFTWAAYATGAGASSTSDETAVVLRVDDGTRGVALGIYIDSTAFGVYDRVAAVQKALVTGLADKTREWRVAVYAKEDATVLSCRVWYRLWDGGGVGEEDRAWTFVGAYSLADDGGTVGTNRVSYGAFTATTPQADLRMYHGPHFTFGDVSSTDCIAGSGALWRDWAAATYNPSELSTAPLSPRSTYLTQGVRVRGVDGPAFAGDSWTLAPLYEFPVERVYPNYSRSPRNRWRSADDASQQTIAIAHSGPALDTDSAPGGSLMALYLGGINWRTGKLQRRTGAAWVDVLTIDTSDRFGAMAFTRTGLTFAPNDSTSTQIAAQELVGWDLRISGASPAVTRRIAINSGGRWSTGATAGPRARIQVEKVTGSEAASGDALLCPREVCYVFEVAASVSVAGWRLVIDAQDTVEGHFEIGAMMVGPVYVGGQPSDWGRMVEQQIGAVHARQVDGTTTSRDASPAGQLVGIAWTGGVDARQFHDGTSEPDYITTTATAGVEGPATLAGTVYDLANQVASNGAHPVVYLPRIERAASGDVRLLCRWYELLYCHIRDGVRITHSIGDEGVDETMTVAALRLEPEL